jgi:hypothetical protein
LAKTLIQSGKNAFKRHFVLSFSDCVSYKRKWGASLASKELKEYAFSVWIIETCTNVFLDLADLSFPDLNAKFKWQT